ncbi:S8 family peptidase [Microbacterium caowuchunii]|uniref:S8 family peptidase n=1 Tax=Microbacterium caowuchunii TaxID=2614638 RepID=A0A5N0TE85_9MICO|nr:S8/S53 family peptidase [Microbacterium caowuchunii]KAA9132166.1 S8 family peptidase [Microbacterium caowuchunii]
MSRTSPASLPSRPSSRRARRLLVGLAIAATMTAGAVLPAQASENGQWWYELYDVPAAHAAGWTGEGVKVAVIDAAINPDLPVFEGANLTVDETPVCLDKPAVSADFSHDTNHGSTITALLIGNGEGGGAIRGIAPDASVTFYGWGVGAFDGEDACPLPAEVEERGLTGGGWALERAMADGAEIVTTSIASSSFSAADEEVIAQAIARGVVFVSAISNDAAGDPLANFPSAFNGVVTVNAFDVDGNLQTDAQGTPVIDNEVTVVAAGVDIDTVGTATGGWADTIPVTGSSLSAPIVAGMLAVTSQKYPEAGGNQLIQSLIHNTWADDHELEYDPTGGFGYGAASLGHLLRVDPAQYPDENPIMDRRFGGPSLDQIAQYSSEAPAATPSAAPSAPTADEDAPGWVVPVVIGAVVLLIVIVGAVILTIVLVRRSKKNPNGGTP